MDLAEVKKYSPEKIGSGKFATVYRLQGVQLPDAPFPVAFKRFKKSAPRVAPLAMQSVVEVRTQLAEPRKRRMDELATWPLRVVTSGGRVSGILMRLIPDEFFFQRLNYDGTRESQLLEATYLLQQESYCTTWGIPYLTLDQRMQFLQELAYALAFLHRADVVYGDLSDRNVVCGFGANGRMRAMLVDCDAVLKEGTSPIFGNQAHSPTYYPPESLAARKVLESNKRRSQYTRSQLSSLANEVHRQNKRTDVYKYALMVLRVLDHGPNKSQLTDPQNALRIAPASVRRLLLRSLDDRPANRPTMRDWLEDGFERRQPKQTMPGFAQQPDGSWRRV